MKVGYDVFGNIALLKFDRDARLREKKKFALEYLARQKNVTTVLEKTEKFSGRLRTLKTKWLAGEKTTEALYKENGCLFRLNIETCYFSPRLSTERLEVARMVKPRENVLVMFGGVAPFAIVIGKFSKAAKVVSVELGRECSKYAIQNVKRNKLTGRVEVVQGDVRRVIGKGKKVDGHARRAQLRGAAKSTTVPSHREQEDFAGFDRIVMARPNLKDSFLDVAFSVIKKGGVIHYYGFYPESEAGKLNELIKEEARKAGKKIKILDVRKAGDIGPYKFRYRADVKVMS